MVSLAKIVIIAQGQHIAQYCYQLQKQLANPDELEIVVAHMEAAVRKARQLLSRGDIDVIVARGTTTDLLRNSNLAIPIVDIPIGDTEILSSIRRAKEKSALKDPLIGFLGFSNVISPVKSFLEIMDLKVKLYEIHTTKDTLEMIKQAKRDSVDVLIAGALSCEMISREGIANILLESSFQSISEAYRHAKEVQQAVNAEKKKAEEKNIIFNSVSDAILSIDDRGCFTLLNKHAQEVFGCHAHEVCGCSMNTLLQEEEIQTIQHVYSTGEEAMGEIWERQGRKYALSIVPIIVDHKPAGVVVTLRELNALQKMETTVRKGLYQKGNTARYTFEDIKGDSPQIRETIEIARSFSRMQSSVLIIGETGTGKELFAQSIHNASSRRDGPFVAVNCGAIPSNLVESELFGYVDGAFTGAKKGGKMGLFELAHSGTLFLDEISEMGLQGQVILLRALQERQIRRVGGDTIVPVDVRIIAACNVNLYELVRQNKFRKDLYYRLSVLVVKVPPLRDRQGDISHLATYFVEQYNQQFGRKVLLSDAALRELELFLWDGNLRQLKNFCERITALSNEPVTSGAFIRQQLHNSFWFEQQENHTSPAAPPVSTSMTYSEDFVVIKGHIYSRGQLSALLAKHSGNREAVAKQLGISRTTLWKSLKKVQLSCF